MLSFIWGCISVRILVVCEFMLMTKTWNFFSLLSSTRKIMLTMVWKWNLQKYETVLVRRLYFWFSYGIVWFCQTLYSDNGKYLNESEEIYNFRLAFNLSAWHETRRNRLGIKHAGGIGYSGKFKFLVSYFFNLNLFIAFHM